MGTEKRVEPGMENKLSASIPGPTKYQLPSLVRHFNELMKISGNCRSKKDPGFR